jgi:hypothetical protein
MQTRLEREEGESIPQQWKPILTELKTIAPQFLEAHKAYMEPRLAAAEAGESLAESAVAIGRPDR